MRSKTRRSRAPLWALAAVLPLLALPPAGGAHAQDNVLRIIPHADLRVVDPIWTTGYIVRNHGYMVYDTLFAMDENLQPQPQMVDSWEVSEDRLVYEFTLREGLLWHDGEPVRAADAVASIERWGARDGMGQQLMRFTEALEAVDDRTFTLTLSEPYALVLESLGKISSNVPFIMPERLARTDPFEQVTEVLGSGPFKFVEEEWEPGHRVVYVKNEDYVPRDEPASFASGGKVVNFDRVEWHYIPDHATAIAALNAGEVDLYENPPVDLIASLEANPDVVVEVIDPIGTQGWIRPNTLHPPFDHPKARQALLYATNQEDYMRAVIGEERYWRTCPAYFICGTALETDAGAEALLTRDLDKARALMEEAGYDGRPVVVMDPTDTPFAHVSALITAQNLRDIGVNVQVVAMDWSTMLGRRAMKEPPDEGGWNVLHTWWVGTDVLNPSVNIGISAACDRAWFGWPCDETMEEMRLDWARAGDAEEQRKIAEEIQVYLYEELVPYIPFGQWFLPTAYRSNLEGVIISPVPFFWNIAKH
jgi:peptide/nickel transport system substrate-binding protein